MVSMIIPPRLDELSSSTEYSLTSSHHFLSYWAKVQDERKAKADRYKADKAAEDIERQQSQFEIMRENAKIPAFSRELEDCGVLIGWFKRFGGVKGEDGEGAGGEEGKALPEGVSRRI